MKNECRGSGFDIRISRPFLEPGDETECSWCHRMVRVTRGLHLRAHSLASAPVREGLRGPVSGGGGPRRAAQR